MNWFCGGQAGYSQQWLEAMAMVHPDRLQVLPSDGTESAVLLARDVPRSRPAILISGGGSDGPWIPGYVGPGMADAAVIGAPFAAPNAYTLYETGRRIQDGHGVLLLYNNFMGDYLNNDMAAELLQRDGIPAVQIPICDDLCTPELPHAERGGRIAAALLIKVARGLSEAGLDLSSLVNLVKEAEMRCATLSMTADPEKNLVFLGEGFSGEPAFTVLAEATPESASRHCIELLLEDLMPTGNESFYLLVNRMRLMSYSDSYIFAGHLCHALQAAGPVRRTKVAPFSNLLDRYGLTVTVLCASPFLFPYLDAPVSGDCFTL